jgi:phenylacetic acid degradation operon negative regulatory protein
MVNPTQRPRSLILTVYGAYLRPLGGWIAIADLITLLAELDVDAQAVRSAISRLKRRGTVAPERRDGVSGYALSAEGERMFAEGDRRIFGRAPSARLADGWVLAVFSVPESERERRHLLRSQLTWLGFGTTAAGVWVAPVHLLDEARATLLAHGLDRYVHLFRADYVDFAPPGEAVAGWWDLDGLQRGYGEWLERYAPVLERWRRDGGSDERAFADYVAALTDWRRLPYLDPGLPAELLPARWNAEQARHHFADLTALLRAPGQRHVTRTTTTQS